jgi:hypothetical protein
MAGDSGSQGSSEGNRAVAREAAKPQIVPPFFYWSTIPTVVMKTKKNKWIAVIVIWALVALALAINERHSWVGRAQVTIDLFIVAAISILVLVNWVRRGFDLGAIRGKPTGILGRMKRFAFDEDARVGKARPK